MENDNKRFYKSYVSSQLNLSADYSVMIRTPFCKKIVKIFFPRDKNSNILELGCGHGVLINEALNMGYTKVFGVDISEQQIELACNLGIKNVTLSDCLDVLRSYQDNSLDFIVAIDLFEHFTKYDLVIYLDEIYRVLCKNGALLFRVPNGASPFFGNILYGDYTHSQAFTQISIRQLLRSTGFNNINLYEDPPIIHGLISFLRRITWEFIRIIFKFVVAVETGFLRNIFTQNIICYAKK